MQSRVFCQKHCREKERRKEINCVASDLENNLKKKGEINLAFNVIGGSESEVNVSESIKREKLLTRYRLSYLQEKPTVASEVAAKEMKDLKKAITLCVPYSASIGGISTVTGCIPNLVLLGQFEE